MMRTFMLGIVLGIAIVCFATTAFSSDAHARGAVLKIDGENVYVDLGTEAGVATGSLLTLFHVIKVKHPVSGNVVRDSFPLAKLRVINAGANISVAVVPGPFRERIAVGDEIELASEPVTVTDPWTRPSGVDPVDPYAQQNAAPAVESAASRRKKIAKAEKKLANVATLEATWSATLGQSPARRVELWQAYLQANPATPYSKVVSRAIDELDELIAQSAPQSDHGRAVAVARARTDTLGRLIGLNGRTELLHARPTSIDEGVAMNLAFLAVAPQSIAKAWLYYRKPGDTSYLRLELIADGDSYLVGEVPASSVRPPGVDYFVEVIGHDQGAEPRAVIASERAPIRVAVLEAPAATPVDQRGRSRVSVALDYVDFDGPSGEFDQYWYGEVDFMYRFRRKRLYSLRLGFGSMNGTGGPKDVIDDDPTNSCMEGGVVVCREVAYNYAYTELEWHIGDYFGVMLRPQWGSAYRDDMIDNANREFFDAFGLRGRLRFGREDASNLVLGASATQELGRLFEAGFTWDVLEEFPLVFSVHVTDQPVIEDFGVRLLADIGWRRFKWVYPSLRIAYQARDIDHAGLSGGVAFNFDW